MDTADFWSDLLSKVVWAVLCFICGLLSTQLKKLRAREKAREKSLTADIAIIKDALRHTLRAVLISDYDKYVSRGWCSALEKQEYQASYETYHALNGNGVVTHKDETVLELPDHPPEVKQ